MGQEKENGPLPSGNILQTQPREAPVYGPSLTANRNQNRTPQEPIQAQQTLGKLLLNVPGPELFLALQGATWPAPQTGLLCLPTETPAAKGTEALGSTR